MLTTYRAITHRHNEKLRNRFLKHNRENKFLSNVTKMHTKQAHPDMTLLMTMISKE